MPSHRKDKGRDDLVLRGTLPARDPGKQGPRRTAADQVRHLGEIVSHMVWLQTFRKQTGSRYSASKSIDNQLPPCKGRCLLAK